MKTYDPKSVVVSFDGKEIEPITLPDFEGTPRIDKLSIVLNCDWRLRKAPFWILSISLYSIGLRDAATWVLKRTKCVRLGK